MSRAQNSVWRLGDSQAAVAYTGTAGSSTAVGAQTYAVRITVTTAAHVAVGNGATATTGDAYLPADTPLVVQCLPGERVSAIQVATGGNLYVTELTH